MRNSGAAARGMATFVASGDTGDAALRRGSGPYPHAFVVRGARTVAAFWQAQGPLGPTHHVPGPFHSLLVFQSGHGDVLTRLLGLGAQRSALSFGKVLWLPADRPAFIEVPSPHRVIGIDIPTDILPASASEGGSTRPGVLARDGVIQNLSASLLAATQEAPGSAAAIVDAVSGAVAAHLMRAPEPMQHFSRPGPAGDLQRVMDHLQDHLAESHSLDELAQLSGYHPHHFAHAFKRHTGVSPMKWLMQQRLQRAHDLVLSTDWSLTQVAAQVGFQSSAHFSRAFHEHWGMTASHVRARRQIAVGHKLNGHLTPHNAGALAPRESDLRVVA